MVGGSKWGEYWMFWRKSLGQGSSPPKGEQWARRLFVVFCVCHFGYVIFIQTSWIFSRYIRHHLQEIGMYLSLCSLWILLYWWARLVLGLMHWLSLPEKRTDAVWLRLAYLRFAIYTWGHLLCRALMPGQQGCSAPGIDRLESLLVVPWLTERWYGLGFMLLQSCLGCTALQKKAEFISFISCVFPTWVFLEFSTFASWRKD